MGLSAQAAKNLLMSEMHCSCRLILNYLIVDDSWRSTASLLSSPGPGSYLRSCQWAPDATGEVKWQSAQNRSARGQMTLQPALRSHWGSVCSLKVFQNVSWYTSEWEKNAVTWVWPGQQKAGTFHH